MTMHSTITSEAPLPEWRLDDLYTARDDPKIEADLKAGAAAVAELVKLKGAFVGARGNASRLGLLLDQGVATYEKATNLILATGAYAGLAASTARDDPAWAKFESDLRARHAEIGADSLFLTLELNQLEEWEIENAFKAHPRRRTLAPMAAPRATDPRARADVGPGAASGRPRPGGRQLVATV